ncbi:tissue factor pathway inhibitor [Trichonephila clavata]|uniref:Tissue factor pathway inhibitor n=1 Tax=Trichonephila clavata TaxID=2740835 RepID=A0A8X6GV58_TRICU|nr:tissue factor pathway inhibitor [Trichonephila clavata]
MKLFVFLALVAGAFALQECPENSHYESCGTACPLTCKNYKSPPKFCVLMCNPGCHCDSGYVKSDDGSCVLPEECSSNAPEQVCGVNEQFNSCGTDCPLTCDNYDNPPRVCNMMCRIGCECKEGFVRNRAGKCVKPEQCPQRAEQVCGENERYNGCGTACPLTCDNYDNPPKFCNFMCKIGCECEDGYVRSNDGRCVRPEQCPQRAEEKNCEDKPESGMCMAYMPMWYYDTESQTCKKFIYGGCQGNGNRYASKEECMKQCGVESQFSSDICDLPAETGRCFGYFQRYYFDKEAKQCKKFVFGGCGGNENNFKTLEECQGTCGNRAEQVCGVNEQFNGCGTDCPLTCDNYDNPPIFCNKMCRIGCECKKGFVRNRAGKCVKPEQCPQRAAALDRPDCDKAAETGVCRAFIPRFYYDQVAGMCKSFIYGGCGGNRNNFETEEECYNKCGALASSNPCDQEKKKGPCRAAFRKYFFNKETGKCELFYYGGCQGNDNRFNTQAECEAMCVH